MEHQQLTASIAVDLSAAFDTVHHQLLLDVLETSFGVRSKAKQWITSYFTDRNFEVHVHDSCSDAININFSVPQGSINGPVLFTCYASTLQYSIGDGINLIGYADDHNVYASWKASDSSAELTTLSRLTSTMDNVKRWMHQNRLKMNDDKSEFIVFGSTRLLSNCLATDVKVGDIMVSRSNSVKVLGVTLDKNLSLKSRHAALALFN
ncbi:hypothetical protein SNE40_022879 [Patella caerulea]|uniref:Reverse transcriptase domain-containing protein n=1 Tax=Patella caerulea TaxID=87958 RepID=A0AAN8IZY8_PATCE